MVPSAPSAVKQAVSTLTAGTISASTSNIPQENARQASAAARSLLLFGRVIGEDEVLAGLDAVTREGIARLAEETFTGPAALAAAGPVKSEGFYRSFL